MNDSVNMRDLIRADEDQKCLWRITTAFKPGSVLWVLASGLRHKSIDSNEPLPVRTWEHIVDQLVGKRRLIGKRHFKKPDNQIVRCAIARLRDARRLVEGVL